MQFQQLQNITKFNQCSDRKFFNHTQLTRCDQFVFRNVERTIQTEVQLIELYYGKSNLNVASITVQLNLQREPTEADYDRYH